ncbi:MAG: hypothetical protein VX167_01665 [Pseudomonadota bacterium]|nr:hypothetical protein [Pseudomonadota bacterium]
MAVSPCSFDFFSFLYAAEVCRKRRKLEEIELVFVHGTKGKFRSDNIRTQSQNEMFFNNVIIPGISLLQAISSFSWKSREEMNFDTINPFNIFPRGYQLLKPVHEYLSHELVSAKVRGDEAGKFNAPDYAVKLAKKFIEEKLDGRKFITLTTREIERDDINNSRSIDTQRWHRTLNAIKELDVVPLVIRDTDRTFSNSLFDDILEAPVASIHLPFRFALYEQSLLNFTRNNGPSTLMLYGNAPSIFFSEFDDDVVAVSEKWFRNNYGMVRGDQFPMTTKATKFRWGDDDTDYVLNEVRAAIDGEVYHDELHPFEDTENVRASISVAIRHFIKCVNFNVMFEDATLLAGISKITQQFGLMPDLVQQIKDIQGHQIPSNTLELLEKNFNLILEVKAETQ